MILNITFSKPSKNFSFDKPFIKVRIRKLPDSNLYDAEFFTQTQSFQKKMTSLEVDEFYKNHAGKSFKNVVCTTETSQITTLANKHGKITNLTKKISENTQNNFANIKIQNQNQTETFEIEKKYRLNNALNKKNYILKEGKPIPFLVKLGVMSKEGKVLASKYDKFRQINRFLEIFDDVLDDVKNFCIGKNDFTKERPLYVADFGCGKSYLSFAIYYFLTEIKHIPSKITGMDLKSDVIENCNKLAQECSYSGLNFIAGNVEDAKDKYKISPDIMITLHACDTATDYALKYALDSKVAAILSVPCCQHEVNLQLEKMKLAAENPFAVFTKWGIIQERFSALATDAIRGELLEQSGYSVQLLEFIDFEGTPKNILIRAVRKKSVNENSVNKSKQRLNSLLKDLNVLQTFKNLLEKN